MADSPKLTSKQVRTLWWGKLRRYLQHTFWPGYIASSHARREGECLRCGACCRIGSQCPHFDTDDDDLGLCKRHEVRPRNCRIFPVDERDLADRDIVSPDTTCGFSFRSNGHAAPAPESEATGDGPSDESAEPKAP